MAKRVTKKQREKRSEAARKGWETRRARAEAERLRKEREARATRERKARAKAKKPAPKKPAPKKPAPKKPAPKKPAPKKRGELTIKVKPKRVKFKPKPVRKAKPKKVRKPRKPRLPKPLPQVTTQRIKGQKQKPIDKTKEIQDYFLRMLERLPKLKDWLLEPKSEKDRDTRFDLWTRAQMALEQGHQAMLSLAGIEGYSVREIYSIAYGSP